ncbi:MAG: glycine betaine/L-proline ABC transporter ATP-binding protein [Chloroflexota bacterium]
MEQTKVKISCRNLWKIYGPRPADILSHIKENETKEAVQKQTGHVIALRDISFDVNEGEIFVIMGLSGSGKSTLIRCLNRLIEPTRGQIAVDGVDLAAMEEPNLRMLRRNKISMVFQHFALFPNRSVIDNVAYGLEVQGTEKSQRRERSLEKLEMVGLKGWENNYPDELSGGMRQRVGLARALAVDPEILLLDEAFSALDPLIRRELQDEFIALMTSAQKTVVFVTHDLNEALKLGDRIAIMKDGQFIQIGAPEELTANPADEYVSDFLRDINRSKVILVKHIMTEPKLILYDWQGPRVALYAMRDKNIDRAFVVDVRRRPRGVVTLNEVRRSIGRKVSELSAVEREDFSQIGADSTIDEAVPLAASSSKPVVVIDGDGRLIGEVPHVALLSAMAGVGNNVKEGENSSDRETD